MEGIGQDGPVAPQLGGDGRRSTRQIASGILQQLARTGGVETGAPAGRIAVVNRAHHGQRPLDLCAIAGLV